MKFNLVGAAAVALAAFATPGLAQVVIEDPDYCEQFYQNTNCQSPESGNTDGVYYHDDPAQTAEPSAYRYHGGPKSND
jgi:hypothetical protein